MIENYGYKFPNDPNMHRLDVAGELTIVSFNLLNDFMILLF